MYGTYIYYQNKKISCNNIMHFRKKFPLYVLPVLKFTRDLKHKMLLKKEVCNRQNISVSTCNKYSLDEDRSIIATNVYVQISSERI